MWPCEARRRAKEAELDAELEAKLRRPSDALAMAAAAPEPPPPTARIELPLEGRAKVLFAVTNPTDLARLWDWLDNGRYADLFDEAVDALRRDRS